MFPLARLVAAMLPAMILPLPAMAAGALNSGDTAWIIAATALVLFMTLPGLALFYAGLVRSEAVLSVIRQCFAIACLASVLWLAIGYSLAFGDSVAGWIGGLNKAFFAGVTSDVVSGTIPEIVFAMFQMTFAIITPALIVGAYPERMKFSAVLWMSGLWLLLVYAPVCHWIWGGGWLAEMGVMDFAGGVVVHTTAGSSAVVIAVMLGARRGFPSQLRPPHNPGMTATGAAMLWVGWYGFNGGSQLAADGGAGMAIAATHIAAATAALTWMAIEWIKFGKPSMIGAVTGVIAGLATVTPASGFVGPMGGLILGFFAGIFCFWGVQIVKNALHIDDSLDVFAVHGIGGILGSLLVSVLALDAFGGGGLAEGQTAVGQLGVQALAVGVTLVWSVGFTFLILKVTGVLTGGLRVSEDQEIEGLDLASHGERSYDIGR